MKRLTFRRYSRLLLGFLFLASGCLDGGTGTGNPGMGSTAGSQNLASFRILNGVCAKLNQCVPGTTVENCRFRVSSVTNLEAPLGITTGTYANYLAILLAENADTLRADPAATGSCLVEISNLACSNPDVQTAVGADGNFNGVARMLENGASSCAGVF